MRIIIEASEQAGLATASHQVTPPGVVETIDGGAPSAALLQAVAEALPLAAEGEGANGGAPPDWLFKAIEGMAQANPAGSLSADNDGGRAPGSES